jgi:hypothetical protein
MLRLPLLALGLLALTGGLALQVSGFRHRTREAPSLPCFSPRYYFIRSDVTRSWFESETAFRRVRVGGFLIAVGGALVVLVFWVL